MRGNPETGRLDEGVRRVRRWFWALAVVAVAGTGSLSSALTAPASAVTAVWFAASGVVTTASVLLLVRIMAALLRRGRGVEVAVPSRRTKAP